jgi:histidinol dehydrogenase
MLRLLESGTPALAQFLHLLARRRGHGNGVVDDAVAKIISQVRRGGDRALLSLTRRFDGVTLALERIRVDPKEIQSARAALPSAERRALELAARRIADFHRRTLERRFSFRDGLGMRLGQLVHCVIVCRLPGPSFSTTFRHERRRSSRTLLSVAILAIVQK